MAKFGEGGELLKCSFCGKSQKQVKKLIAGPGVYICDECIDLCNEIIEEELAESGDVDFGDLPKPAEIHEFLNTYIIGQDHAKKILAVAVYNHYKRVEFGATLDNEVELSKSVVLEALHALDEGSDDSSLIVSIAKAKIGDTAQRISNEGSTNT